jgi:aspartyl-tRNA synthetase
MQASRCNECGEEIGGGSHRLLNTNRRAEMMESIAAEQGQHQSPWEWGQEA